MKDNVLLDKSFAFAVRVANAHKFLIEERKEYTLSKFFLTSGTNIGAYAEEPVGAEGRSDFLTKLTFAYKDARRTRYYIRLLQATGYFDDVHAASLLADVEELLKIIGSIQRTTKQNS
jgi:four helix bundle protein